MRTKHIQRLVLLCFMLAGFGAQAQTLTTGIGTSAAYTDGSPVYRSSASSSFNYAISGNLYKAAQLGSMSSGSSISQIAFNKATAFTFANGATATLIIYMRNSTVTAIPTSTTRGTIQGYTQVYSNSNQSIPAAAGYISFTLSTPFTYTGGSLEVYVDWAINTPAPSNPTNGAFTWQYSAGTSGQSIGTSSSSALTTSTTLSTNSSNSYNAKITYAAGVSCAGTPAAGTATASVTNACSGVSFNLSATGLTAGTGITYQWQSSPTGAGTFTNITGATTNPYTVASQTAATDYKIVTTCTNGGATATSSTVAVGQNAFTACYCVPNTTSGITYFVSNFTTTGGNTNINQTSTGNTAGYQDFSATSSGTFTTGSPIGYSMTVAGAGTYGYAIWIDTSADGTFQTNEQFVSSTAYSASPISGTFTIPNGTTAGQRRMRIIASYTPSNPSNPCTNSGAGEYEDYTITLVAATNCAGTPAAGTATASVTSTCGGVSFSLSATGLTAGTGITYQWQSSPTGAGTFTNITGATTNPYTVASQTAATDYKIVTTCTNGGATATSNTVAVGQNAFTACYCASNATSTADEDILNVTVGTLNNTSTCATVVSGPGSILNEYSNFTSGTGAPAAPVLTTGTSASYSIGVGSCGATTYSSGTAIFIDWNQDGNFTGPGEKVADNGATTQPFPYTLAGSFTVPVTATIGTTRMRVVNIESTAGTSVTSCGTYTFGETEDYLVNVVAGMACTGTPNGGTATPATANLCAGATTILTVTGQTTGVIGLTYQWEQSSSNSGPWSNVVGGSGETTLSYTTPAYVLSTPIYYRLKITCSGNDGFSTAALVTDPAAPATAASNITFAPSSSTAGSGSLGWTNGSGNRRVVYVNDVNTFTDPVSPAAPPGTLSTAYSGTGQQLVYDNTSTSVTITGLTAGTTYYARVYEVQRCGTTDYYYNVSPATNNPNSFIIPPPPANDECSTATTLITKVYAAISGVCPGAVSGTTVSATLSSATAPPTSAFSSSQDDDVWYEFVATQTSHYVRLCNVTFPVGTGTPVAMGIVLNPGCTAGSAEITGVPSGSTITLVSGAGEMFFDNLTIGTTYKARILTSGTTSRANFDISILGPQSQTYVSSTSTQPSTASVAQGTTNAQVLQVAVVTTGTLNPLTLTQLNLSTNGTTNVADLANARVYYTGTSTVFSTTTPFGSVVANPNGSFSITGSQVLAGGAANTNNYFQVVYDVACTATIANVIDAEVSSIVVGGSPYVPTVTAPAGTRAITSLYATVPRTDPNGTTAIIPGAANAQMVYANIQGSAACGAIVTALNTTLTLTSGDVTSVQAYYTSTATFSTATPFGSAVINPVSGTLTISGGTQALATGSNYFWLVFNVACTATAANTLNADINSLVVGGVTVPTTGTGPAANAIGTLYATSKTDPNSTTVVMPGATNAQFSRILVTGNANCPAVVTSITAAATFTNANDVVSAKVYYTTTATFDANTPFGTAIGTLAGTLTFTGTQALGTSSNYFWLVYDIACTATPANTLNGDINSVVIGANTITPTGTAAAANAIGTLTVVKTDPNGTTAIPVGSQDAQAVLVTIPATGNCVIPVSAITIDINGTASATDLTGAQIYYTTTPTFSTAVLFGSATAPLATGIQVVTGTQVLSATTSNYFWLVYDVSCTATIAGTVNGDITSVTIDGTPRTPTGTAPAANAINANPTGAYYSSSDGAWDNGITWACGTPPPSAITPVVIGNAVTIVTNTPLAGSVTINGGASLTIAAGGVLTMGASSAGAATGNSNRVLTIDGTLNFTGGTLNLNGSAVFSAASNFNMSSGTFNIDPNDGTVGNSATGSSLKFLNLTNASQVNATGGNIIFIDPPFGSSFYSVEASVIAGVDLVVGNTVTFDGNGGDDVNTANNIGFSNEGSSSSGSMELSNLIIAGGRYSTQRHTSTKAGTSFLSKVRNITVNAGAELLLNTEPFAVIGNLVNNGIITSTATTKGNGLIMAGAATYNSSVKMGPATVAQSISGTGFFKVTTAAQDPTAQTGNLIAAFSVYHDGTTSPGLTLNMPLTVLGELQMLGGKVNATLTTPLALGNGTAIPGNPAPLVAGRGTLYGNAATGLLSYNAGTTFSTPQTYVGGWVDGAFSRFVTGTSSGEPGLMPLGTPTGLAPALIEFTAAPTTPGYLQGEFVKSSGSSAINPPLQEPGITPSTLNRVRNDYWQIVKDGALTGGTYNITLNQRESNLGDFTKVALVKRADAVSPWTVEGTFVATSGSNVSPVLKRNNLSSFSQFAMAAENSQPLPVNLTTITARAIGKTNRVDWISASEQNTAVYEVQGSGNGSDFKTIGKVDAQGKAAAYTFVDEAPAAGISYYRLRFVGTNGSEGYSRTVTATQGRSNTVAMTAYPNPATDRITVEVAGATEGATITLKDLTGKTLAHEVMKGDKVEFLMTHLPAGMYFAVYTGGNATQVIKVSKQ